METQTSLTETQERILVPEVVAGDGKRKFNRLEQAQALDREIDKCIETQLQMRWELVECLTAIEDCELYRDLGFHTFRGYLETKAERYDLRVHTVEDYLSTYRAFAPYLSQLPQLRSKSFTVLKPLAKYIRQARSLEEVRNLLEHTDLSRPRREIRVNPILSQPDRLEHSNATIQQTARLWQQVLEACRTIGIKVEGFEMPKVGTRGLVELTIEFKLDFFRSSDLPEQLAKVAECVRAKLEELTPN